MKKDNRGNIAVSSAGKVLPAVSVTNMFDDEIKRDRRKFGLWIKDFPIIDAEYYIAEDGEKTIEFHILLLTLIEFEFGKSKKYEPLDMYAREMIARGAL